MRGFSAASGRVIVSAAAAAATRDETDVALGLAIGMSGAGGKQVSAGRFIREVQAAAIENDRHVEMQTIFYEGWVEAQKEIERLRELLRESGAVPPENGGVWTAPLPRWKQLAAEQAQRGGDPDEKATLDRE